MITNVTAKASPPSASPLPSICMRTIRVVVAEQQIVVNIWDPEMLNCEYIHLLNAHTLTTVF